MKNRAMKIRVMKNRNKTSFFGALRDLVRVRLMNRAHFAGAVHPPHPHLGYTPPPPKDAPAAVQ